MNRLRSWGTCFLALAPWTALASCGTGPPGGGPVPPGDAAALQSTILQEVLARTDLHIPDDEIGAICVGWGDTDFQTPSPAFFSQFAGREPPVVGLGACERTVDPQSPYPVIQTAGGDPGLLVVVADLHRLGRTTAQPVGAALP